MQKLHRIWLFGAIVGIAGFSLIVYSLGWIAALGIFLALWGNNMGNIR